MNTLAHDILDLALQAATEAGKITLQYYQTDTFATEIKQDQSPVTIADKRAEEHIVARIRARYPDHAILGEESGETAGSAGVTWILDPIDGTKTFICGVPFYGVLIGVEIAGRVDVGVAHFPALNETYYAVRGGGSFCNGRRIHVSQAGTLAEAVVLTTDTRAFAKQPAMAEAHRVMMEGAKLYRTWGDCYGHMLVASGRAEIMLDAKMSPWDAAALLPIVEEAGGVFTDWAGNATPHGGSAISTNAAIRPFVTGITR